MKFYFEYSPWLLIPMVIVAVAIAIFLYHKDKTFVEIEPWKKRLMTALRAIFIFLTLALLLNPIVKHITRDIRKPIVVIAQDNSKSILYNKSPEVNVDTILKTYDVVKKIKDKINLTF